jgi:hypothetical protein
MHMHLYSFTFDVRPRPENPDYGRIHSRDVTVWVANTTEGTAAAEARQLVDRYGFDITSDGEVREWDRDGGTSPSNSALTTIVRIVERDSYALEFGPEFPPL